MVVEFACLDGDGQIILTWRQRAGCEAVERAGWVVGLIEIQNQFMLTDVLGFQVYVTATAVSALSVAEVRCAGPFPLLPFDPFRFNYSAVALSESTSPGRARTKISMGWQQTGQSS